MASSSVNICYRQRIANSNSRTYSIVAINPFAQMLSRNCSRARLQRATHLNCRSSALLQNSCNPCIKLTSSVGPGGVSRCSDNPFHLVPHLFIRQILDSDQNAPFNGSFCRSRSGFFFGAGVFTGQYRPRRSQKLTLSLSFELGLQKQLAVASTDANKKRGANLMFAPRPLHKISAFATASDDILVRGSAVVD